MRERLTTSALDKAGHVRDGSELPGFSAANAGIFWRKRPLGLAIELTSDTIARILDRKKEIPAGMTGGMTGFLKAANSESLMRSRYQELRLSLDETDSRFDGYDQFRSSGGR